MTACTTCGGPLALEPALVRCVSCGREYIKPCPSEIDLARQRALDLAFQHPGAAAEILFDELARIEEAAPRQA